MTQTLIDRLGSEVVKAFTMEVNVGEILAQIFEGDGSQESIIKLQTALSNLPSEERQSLMKEAHWFQRIALPIMKAGQHDETIEKILELHCEEASTPDNIRKVQELLRKLPEKERAKTIRAMRTYGELKEVITD